MPKPIRTNTVISKDNFPKTDERYFVDICVIIVASKTPGDLRAIGQHVEIHRYRYADRRRRARYIEEPAGEQASNDEEKGGLAVRTVLQ